MNTSGKSYKYLSTPFFKEAFEKIDSILKAHQIPYYLIGANAIALELLKEGIKPSRGTRDIDFAIMISSKEEYEQLSRSFEENGFNKVHAPWTFYSPEYKLAIDILPFGQIEEEYTVNFTERQVDLHVLGFKEVLSDAAEVAVEQTMVKIPPLPGMVILKLVSWSDRPEERENDLADIATIIEHFFDIEYDEILEFHNDTFPEKDEEDFVPNIISAEVLGRKARRYLHKTKELEIRIDEVLTSNLDTNKESAIAKEWGVKKGWSIERSLDILRAFKRGIQHK